LEELVKTADGSRSIKKTLVTRVLASLLVAQLAAMPTVALGQTPGEAPAPRLDPEPVTPTPDARQVGLRDTLQHAVKANPSLAGETIDVAISDAEIHETYGLDDWVLDARAFGTADSGNPVLNRPSSDSLSLEAEIHKPLPTGGSVGLRFDNGYGRAPSVFDFRDQPADAEEGSLWTPTVQLTFDQPLLRGRGRTARYASRTRAISDRAVQVLERETAAATVVRDVIQAYWELAYAAQDLAIRRSSLQLAREQLRITQASIDVGKLPRSEALAVEQTIATREEDVFLAEQAVSERSIELRRLAGMEIGPGELELTAVDGLGTAAVEPDLDGALAMAMDANPQLKAVRQLGAAAQIEVDVTDNGLLPQLDFSLAAGPQGIGTTAADAYGAMGKFESYQVSAGLVLNWQLGNSAAEGRHEAARLRVRKAKLSEADLRAQIAAQTVRAVNLVRSAKKRMEVAARATGLAKQNVELETARWQVGKATNFDVLRRQDELAQSQLREARARADYLNAVALLDALTGQILPRYGIALADR
jgi:outer membrane protein